MDAIASLGLFEIILNSRDYCVNVTTDDFPLVKPYKLKSAGRKGNAAWYEIDT